MSQETQEKSEVYRFNDCVVDGARRELTVDGETVTVQPKAFELLLYLIRNRHRAVDKDELQDALWPRSIVTETALTRCVMKARRAVGDDAERQSAIKTVHGHGYRFIADIDEAAEPAMAVADNAGDTPKRGVSWQPFAIGGTIAGLLAIAVAAWVLLSPPALAGPVRLAVLPVENATGDPEMDWVSTGLMALMSRMLEDSGIDIVSTRDVSALAGDGQMTALVATGSQFREKIHKASAATHVIGARIETSNGLFRLTYILAGVDARPARRTMVGKEPTQLIRSVVDTVTTLVVDNPDVDRTPRSVSNDDFLNEVFARAMSLYHEGRYQDARELLQVVIEQEPHLFWPRYEHALATRNLREHETAERELIALRAEFGKAGWEKEQAAVENALGIMYMNRQRNDEAKQAFEKTAALAAAVDDPRRTAVAFENLALLEKNVGNLDLAFEHMQRAEQVYHNMDIEILPGSLHNNMSGILIQQGQFEAAEQRSLQAIDAFRFRGQRLYESYAMSRLSGIYTRLRYYDQATDLAEQSLAVREELEDDFGVASSLLTIADIAAQRGDVTKSLQHARQAYDIGKDLDDHRIIASSLVRIARSELRLDNPQVAANHFQNLETLARNVNDAHNVFRARLGLAQTMIARSQFDDAHAIGTELLNDARDKNQRRDETAALRVIADVYLGQARTAEAVDVLREVLAIAEEIGDSVVTSSMHIALGDAYLELADTDAARPHVAAAAEQRPDDLDSPACAGTLRPPVRRRHQCRAADGNGTHYCRRGVER